MNRDLYTAGRPAPDSPLNLPFGAATHWATAVASADGAVAERRGDGLPRRHHAGLLVPLGGSLASPAVLVLVDSPISGCTNYQGNRLSY